MLAIVKSLHLLALIVWVGEIVFFSFVGAPAVFRTLPTTDAGRTVGAIFPTYYWVGYVCGVVLVITSMVLLSAAVARFWWYTSAGLAALMLVLTLYAGVVIQPRASALRPQIHAADTPQSTKDEFGRLHRNAVLLNGAVLLCGLAVTVITATKLQP